MNRRLLAFPILAAASLVGCANRPAGWQRNSEASLNKPATQFEADAKRRAYPADLPRGDELPIRAEIGYMWNVITLVNYSKQAWPNTELWVNRQYVISLDKLEPNKAIRVGFKLLYDAAGKQLPENGVMIDTLELKKDGMLYDVPKQIGG